MMRKAANARVTHASQTQITPANENVAKERTRRPDMAGGRSPQRRVHSTELSHAPVSQLVQQNLPKPKPKAKTRVAEHVDNQQGTRLKPALNEQPALLTQMFQQA